MDNSIDVGSKAVNMASYVLFAKVLTFAMIGVAFILVTRILGPAQYGVYTLAVAFAGIFGSIGYMGVGLALNKFVAQYKEAGRKEDVNRIVSSALALVVVSGLIVVSAFMLVSGQISQYVFHTVGMGYVIDAISLWIIGAMLFGTFYDVLVGLGNGKGIAIIATMEAFFQASISIILAFEGFGALAPIYGLVSGYFIGFFVGMFFVFRYNGLSPRLPSFRYIKTILSFSAPLALSSIIGGVAGNIGLIFLGYFVLPGTIGNIGIATRASSMLSMVFDSIGIAILPTFAAALADRRTAKDIGRIYGYTVYMAMVLVAPALLYMAVFSTPFTYTLFGSSYSYAPLYISLMSIGILVGLAGGYASTLLISSGKVKSILAYNIALNAVALLMFFVFIPKFGGPGYAVISFLIMPLAADFIFIGKLRKLYRIRLRFGKFIRLGAVNLLLLLLFVPLGSVIGGIPLLISAAIGFIVTYPILAVLSGGADKADLETIRTLSNSVPFVGGLLRVFVNYAALVSR
ncbi:MAG: oligosaccharide flippase family protein [Candidatus Marsarchaeota archaeon]|nr:oligosaccharide flippase family protein [Candidatus Marsarchaeota archaeon]MCL5412866.1 oligosaccharide flippase family protein [Candidatus Marsarchaeota archaeon]